MIEKDDIDAGKLGLIAVVGALLVLLTGILVKVLYQHIDQKLFLENNLPPARALVKYQTEQEEKLHRYAWADREKQIATIPIEQAISLTLRDLQARQAAGNQVVPTSVPAPTSAFNKAPN